MLIALKTALLRSGKSQYEVARLAGMSETRLSRIVTGRAEATREEQRLIASVLGVTVVSLFPKGGRDE